MTPNPAEIFRVIPSTPVISVGFNDAIDFCVWILEVDGLIVPPFTAHSKKSGQLQALGLSASIWQLWFERVVRSQHPMIHWLADAKPRTFWVEQQLKNCQDMANSLAQELGWDISVIDWDALRVGFENQYDIQKLNAESALLEAELGLDQNLNVSPSELFHGDSALKRSLEQLWQRYDETEWLLRVQRLPSQGAQRQMRSSVSTRLKQPYLNIHLIAYESLIIHNIPTSSIVTSVRLHFESEAFQAFVAAVSVPFT